MRTSFHHQPEAQHPNFPLYASWQADYPIFWHEAADHILIGDGRFRSEADMRRCHDRIASGPHDPLRS